MAAPVIAATEISSVGFGSSTHPVDLPTGIVAGNLLLVVESNNNNETLTIPSDWTQIAWDTGAASLAIHVWAKIADGSEGASFDVTGYRADEFDDSIAWAARITDAYQGKLPKATITNGLSTTPDPPNNDLVRCPPDVLWVAAADSNDGEPFTGYPSDFPDNQWNGTDPDTATYLAVAAQTTNAISQVNPSTFSLGASKRWVAVTIGVSPLPFIQLPLTGVGP